MPKKRMKAPTRAAQQLVRLGIEYELLEYEVPTARDGTTLGVAAARELELPEDACFKTLIALVDGEPACAVVPVAGTLSMKALAAAAGGKRAEMAPAIVAERVTGYVLGGVSPLGQTTRVPIYLDSSVRGSETVYVSAGKRGLELALQSQDLVEAVGGTLVVGLGDI